MSPLVNDDESDSRGSRVINLFQAFPRYQKMAPLGHDSPEAAGVGTRGIYVAAPGALQQEMTTKLKT